MKVIEGYGAPTVETIGEVNDFYVDLETNNVYRCTSVKTIGEEWGGVTIYASGLDNTVYTWEVVGGGSMATPIIYISKNDSNVYMYKDANLNDIYSAQEIKDIFETAVPLVKLNTLEGAYIPVYMQNTSRYEDYVTVELGITTRDADSNEYTLAPRYVYSSEYIE